MVCPITQGGHNERHRGVLDTQLCLLTWQSALFSAAISRKRRSTIDHCRTVLHTARASSPSHCSRWDTTVSRTCHRQFRLCHVFSPAGVHSSARIILHGIVVLLHGTIQSKMHPTVSRVSSKRRLSIAVLYLRAHLTKRPLVIGGTCGDSLRST